MSEQTFRHPKLLKTVLLISFAASSVMLSGCGPVNSVPTPTQTAFPGANTEEAGEPTATAIPLPQGPVIANVNLGQVPQTIDPGLVTPLDASGSDIVENLFAGLVRLDADTHRLDLELAQGWDQLDDGLRWQVSLRQDIYWVSMGPAEGEATRMRPIIAADVVYAVRRACQPDSGAPLGYSPGVFAIEGCELINRQDPETLSSAFIEENLGVRAIDDYTVEFRLVEDTATFGSILASPALRPIPFELVEAAGSTWTDPDMIWTSGPFVVQPSIPAHEGYTLVENPYWPLPKDGNLDIVQISFSVTENSFQAWQTGMLDVSAIPDAQIDAASFGDDPAFRLLVQPAENFLVFLYDVPPLDNPDVRRALSLAIDRRAVIRDVLFLYGEGGVPASSLMPPGTAFAPPYGTVDMPYAPDAAQAALAEAGYAGCIGLPDITLMTDEVFPFSSQLAFYYVEMWEDVLGCTGKFTVQQSPLLDVYTALREQSANVETPRPGITTLGWQADYVDAHHWMADIIGCRDVFPDSYLDQARSCIPLDQELLAASVERDPEQRAASYEEISAYLFGPDGEMPVAPVYYFARPLAVNLWVEAYPLHAGSLRFDRWVIDVEQQP